MQLTEQSLKSIVPSDNELRVVEVVNFLCNRYKEGKVEPLLRFLGDYVSWNGVFAGGVVHLTSLISAQRSLFIDFNQKIIQAASDRSNLIASYVFEAARDEFSTISAHANGVRHKVPHRSLAQALLVRLAQLHPTVNCDALFTDNAGIKDANADVLAGYSGSIYSAPNYAQLFFGMGYHAGSEILADMEFTVIDKALRDQLPDLFHRLYKQTAFVGSLELDTYQWIRVHSGYGVAVEAHHAQMAIQAINLGLEFVQANRETCRAAAEAGFKHFADDQRAFFNEYSYAA
jgi:hypothetical protein